MRSPGYGQVILWLSHLMEKLAFLTSITQSNPIFFHSALRHVLVDTNDTSVAILEDLDGTEDLSEMFVDDDEVEYLDESEEENELDDDQDEEEEEDEHDERESVENNET